MNFIIRPATLEKVSIFSQQGKLLLKQYINTYNNYKLQIGGSRCSMVPNHQGRRLKICGNLINYIFILI